MAHLLSAEEHRVPKAAAFALEYLAVHFDEVGSAKQGVPVLGLVTDTSTSLASFVCLWLLA